MRIGLYVSTLAATALDDTLAQFAAAEARGLHTAWTGQLFDADALTVLALAAQRTERIELGTWVLPAQPRHPVMLALQARTVQDASRGRLLLGIGASHAEVVEKRLGLSHVAPVQHLHEYLDVLRPLLHGERVEHRGEHYAVALQLPEPAPQPPAVFLAALGPAMLRLAGERADGVALWLAGSRFVEQHALPALHAGARAADRTLPRLAAGLPVAITRDDPKSRASAETFLARSAKLPAYRRVLEKSGLASAADAALIGDETRVAGTLERLAALGVTDFTAVLFPVEGDPEAPRRTLDFLSGIASRP
ncbi:MAG: TIGR03564 family F420-dependent LLM class oxidoreductase [Myxococcota bacterium]|nr:LLM class F420-dependent oxidoreductase [Deltaproteobacteria bacterium]MCP4240060.1 TIGR03564 family F420-dependent LLM class oxidoreductase [bacterium]MDP6076081.1 TIGR03564 family F420-dependent LLM class oxidoreductase [Myxococcota bacterium]MDP6244033.1 TIGR03564 family F420-dependent LLM class oxidoreductase [Myxococcota bacterium]MDP7073571.1 TIGR03564 family F420-dependent LLM class oxidoreductase [Myxococcota bacterium]